MFDLVMVPSLSAFFREPLIQFLLLGLLIFAADQYALGNRDDPSLIKVGDDQYMELKQIFVEGQGRDPSASEMKKLIIKWAENEILYREALRMGLDQGDEMIRSRIILKMQNILFNNAIMEAPTRQELEEFFAFKRHDYDIPERIDVEQFSAPDITTLQAADALAQRLDSLAAVPQTYQAALRAISQRPVSHMPILFGPEAATKLAQAPDGHWIGFEQNGRYRLARIVRRYPAEPVELDAVKTRVAKDWQKFRYDIQLADQTRAIAERYSVQMELSPALADAVRVSISPDELHPTTSTLDQGAAQAALN